ncbi:MAG: putative toxin-antitoxin system toxin component, PIN family [Rubrivivax sp.]|nr:putative toxin-antitoxin system toxin component, PIN family [Rubrivivax sp.]
MRRVVLDTDVMVAALRSRTGAAAQILSLATRGQVQPLVSVPLMLEYEAVLTRPEQLQAMRVSVETVLAVLNDFAALADEVQGHFRWRPQVRDVNDEMVLEAAVNGRADALVSFNLRDFGSAPARFGVRLCTPGQFLGSLRP